MTTSAAAPSLQDGELPTVSDPSSWNTGFRDRILPRSTRFGSSSSVTKIGGPFFSGTPTPPISRLKGPRAIAPPAPRLPSQAQASHSCRVRFYFAAHSSPRLAEACAEHATHVDFVHALARQVDPLQRFGDRNAAKLCGRHRAEDAVERAEWRPHRADDDRRLLRVHRHFSHGLCSRYAFTLLMNRSAVAPSMIRWSNERLR